MDAERSSPQQLLRSIDVLMGREHALTSSAVDADKIHRFFDEKMAGVRMATADAPAPSFSTAPPGCSMSRLRTADCCRCHHCFMGIAGQTVFVGLAADQFTQGEHRGTSAVSS